MNGIKLLSTGSAVPAKVGTNDDLAKIVDTNDEWISTRTGIRSRRYCGEGESPTALCLAAARQAARHRVVSFFILSPPWIPGAA